MEKKEIDLMQKVNKDSSVQAASALSTMINKEVKVEFLNQSLEPATVVNKLAGDRIIALSEVTGDITGNIMISYSKEQGLPLLDAIMMQPLGTLKDMTEDAQSAFTELINIIGGAYLSSMANFLGFKIFPNPPKFVGDFGKVKSELISDLKGDIGEVLFVDTLLKVESDHIDGDFFMLFSNDSLNKIVETLKNMN